MLIKRTIIPGYNTGHCSIDVFESINCGFARQMYTKFVNKRYGVEQKIEDEFDDFFIKKSLLDLNLIDDPDFCKPIICNPPCFVKAIIFFVKTNNCQDPNSIQVIVTGGSITCLPPSGASASINYDN